MTNNWTYTISTGVLHCNFNINIEDMKGWAGRGEHKNNPDSVSIVGEGPLPPGIYTIQPGYTHPRLGPIAMFLEPDKDNEMRGRSQFFIHGSSSKHYGEESQGCIILQRSDRFLINSCLPKGYNKLEVVL